MMVHRLHLSVHGSSLCNFSLPTTHAEVSVLLRVYIRKDADRVDRPVYAQQGRNERSHICLLDVAPYDMGEFPWSGIFVWYLRGDSVLDGTANASAPCNERCTRIIGI